MPWFQVDDQLPVHRKVTAAGNAAMGLWVRAGSWCQQNLTGGFVPTDVVRSLGTIGQANALVASGLWHKEEGGYIFHDWDKHQMSVEDIKERKRKRQEAGRKGGQMSGQSRRGEASASATAEQVLNENRTLGPGPALSVVTKGGGVTEGDDPEPPRYCDEHPNDTTEYCRPCIVRRKSHDAWKGRQKQLEADQLEQQRQKRIREAQTLTACGDCDEDGWRYDDREVKCNHDREVSA
jgi:hypothetical protein